MDTTTTTVAAGTPTGVPFRVFHWLADRAGCGYYRGILPDAWLRAGGFADTTTPPPSTVLPDELEVDLVWAQRVTRPEPSDLWTLLGRRGIPRVFDTDDHLHAVPRDSLVAYEYFRGRHGTTHGHLARYTANMRDADLVTTSTEWLAHYVTDELGVTCAAIVPNTVDDGLFSTPAPERWTDRLVVGYSGSDSHHGDLAYNASGIAQAGRDLDVALHLVGGDWTKPYRRWSDPRWGAGRYELGRYPAPLRWPADRLRVTEWLPDVRDLYAVQAGFDVGIAPLAPTVFNAAKSPLKLVELGALGIPYVASDYGPYAAYHREAEAAGGAGGILVGANGNGWRRALTELADEQTRLELGAAGRRHAGRYAASLWAPARADLYREVIR